MGIFPDYDLHKRNEIHEAFMQGIDQAYEKLKAIENYEDDWKNGKVVEGTKTKIYQTPFLGLGGSGREMGGFYQFAKNYALKENTNPLWVTQRWSFERYQDFAFYSDGNWYHGKKVPILVAEVESNPAELLGELAGLLTVRAALKYLFICPEGDVLTKLKKYSEDIHHQVTDFANTSIFVYEIPRDPSPPRSWKHYRADVVQENRVISFSEVTH